MNKVKWTIKDYFIIFIAGAALFVSFFAYKETRFANKLNIDPFISIRYANNFEENSLEFLIKNEGDVDIKNIEVESITAFSEPKEDDFYFVKTMIEPLTNFLEIDEEKSFLINVAYELEIVKESNKGLLVESKIDFIKEKPILVEKSRGFFLAIKAKYRRTPDSKSFEKSSYFFIMPKTSGFEVMDAMRMQVGVFKKIIENLKNKISKY